jgi:hypothetical protein
MIGIPYSERGQNWGERTHDACRIIGCDDGILQSKLVEIERVSSQLWICAVKDFAASYELDKQCDSTLDNILHPCKQGQVLSSRWRTSEQVKVMTTDIQAREMKQVQFGVWFRVWHASDVRYGTQAS